jgi:hypothetical protein
MKRYFVTVGNMSINVFNDMYIFPNKEYILSLYDTDKALFESEIQKIKTKILINK